MSEVPPAAVEAKPEKKLVNFKIDEDFHSWVKQYASDHGTDVTKLIISLLKKLKQKEDGVKRFLELVESDDFSGTITILKKDGCLTLESKSSSE